MSRKSDYDIWFDKFKPILIESLETNDVSLRMYETYGEDLKSVQQADVKKVWTLLDCDGKLYLSPGFHIVNRLNYIICKNSWNEKTRDYLYG
jgi:hypothetical protein